MRRIPRLLAPRRARAACSRAATADARLALDDPRRRLRPRRRHEPVRRDGLRQAGRGLPRDPRPLLHGHRARRGSSRAATVRVLLQSTSGAALVHGRRARRRAHARPGQDLPRRAPHVRPGRPAARATRQASSAPTPPRCAIDGGAGGDRAQGRALQRPHERRLPRRARVPRPARSAAQRDQRRRARGLRRRASCRSSRPPSWPLEALKAQAVAARTYAITTTKGGDGFDQYPDTRSQVYGGVGAEQPTTNAGRRGDRAPGRHLPGPRRSPPTSSRPPAGARRTSRTRSAGRRSRGCAPSTTPTTTSRPRHRWARAADDEPRPRRKLRGLVKGRFRGVKVIRRGALAARRRRRRRRHARHARA